MQDYSHVPEVPNKQYYNEPVPVSEYDANLHVRETWHDGRVGYSTTIAHEPNYAWLPYHGVSAAADDQYQSSQNSAITDVRCSRTLSASAPTRFCQPTAGLYSPSSTEPCPRISSRNKFSFPSEPHPFHNRFPEPNIRADSAEVLSVRNIPSSSHDLAFSFIRGAVSQRHNDVNDVLPSRLQSGSTSPPLHCADDVGDRPLQRRKLSLSSRASSGSSREGSISDGIQATGPSGRRRRATKSPRNRLSSSVSRSNSKGNESESSLSGSYAFSTFSVNLATSDNEPAGDTYMSTVDLQSDTENQIFEHGPTDLPPRQYIGGSDASSPWKPRKNLGTIPGSALDYLPIVEDRMARLERAIDEYLKYRGDLAVQNSILPGMDSDE